MCSISTMCKIVDSRHGHEQLLSAFVNIIRFFHLNALKLLPPDICKSCKGTSFQENLSREELLL